ncbi:odorant receptor Or2 [Cryptotermes secundus]|uniref:odorant receptor Or2 n=1 Tax=Cryptotermes secundus TaxID=105785 RepID=UPI000CD7C0D4|nr:odorant receptor Or2 [Cryptotermes secundus]
MAINVKVMHLVGLWNHHWQNKRSWRYFAYFGYALFMVFILTVHSVSVVLELCFSWGDFTSFANTAWYASNFGASVIKQLFILTQTERVQSVTMKLRGGILSSGLRWSTEQEEISRNTNRQARRLSIMYYTVAVTSVLCVILLGLRTSYRQLSGAVNSANADADANKTMELPLKAWYPVDTQQPGNYLLMFIFQLIVVTVGPMVNIGTDTFLMSLMIHACGEFRVLKKSLRSLKQRAVQLQDEDTSIRSLYPPQRFSVVKYVSDLEDMFSSMMFIQFLSISLRICLMIFLITLTGDKGLAQLTYFQLLFVSFLQGLPFCWYGSELTYQNESVARVVFETPWLEASLHFRRLLMIVVIRAQTTLHLTGGKIYIMSLETFQATGEGRNSVKVTAELYNGLEGSCDAALVGLEAICVWIALRTWTRIDGKRSVALMLKEIIIGSTSKYPFVLDLC